MESGESKVLLGVLLWSIVKVLKRTFRIDMLGRVLPVKDERCNDVYCHNDLKDGNTLFLGGRKNG